MSYQTAKELKIGDTIDSEGFLYWYREGPNPHITSITGYESAEASAVDN